MAADLFFFSLRLVLSNLGVSLRYTGLVFLIGMLPKLLVAGAVGLFLISGRLPVPAELVITARDHGWVVAILVNLYITIIWTRYVLLGEQPSPPRIPISIIRLLQYIASLSVPLALFLAIFVTGRMLFGAQGTLHLLQWVALAAIGLIVAFFSARFAPFITGLLLERPITLEDAWESTKGAIPTLLGLIGLQLIAIIVLSVLVGFAFVLIAWTKPIWAPELATPLVVVTLVLGTVLDGVATWFGWLFGISTSCAIYRHFVQKREIPHIG